MDIFEYIKKYYEEPIRLMTGRIVLGEFFSPIRSVSESFNLTIEAMKKLSEGVNSETEIMPCFVQKDYKGISCQIHKNAESVIVYSEDGRDITSRLPSIVKEVRNLKEGRLILNAVFEMWEDGICQSKEKLSSYLYGGQRVDDKALMASCFDCLWSDNKDLHKFTFKDRFRELSNIALVQSTVGEPNFSKGHLNSAPTSFVQTESELKKALVYFTRTDPLKGAIVRFAEMDYPLNGLSAQIMKMRNYSTIAETTIKEGIKPAFGSPGGKFFIAGKLVKLIPEHTVYVEPFTGGGSVFFRKKPSAKEVINDFDKDIVFLYRFLKHHTEEDISILKRMDWVISKDKFLKFRDKLKAGEKMSKHERFFTLMNLKAYSDAGEMKTFDDRKEGRSLQILSRIAPFKERLKNTIIENMDYKEVIKKYDSPNTFFYIDPPYPKAEMNWKWMPKEEEMEATMNTIKGKFLLSYEVTSAFKKYQKRIIKQRNIANPSKSQSSFDKKEQLISNYPQKMYGGFLYEADMRDGYDWAMQVEDNFMLEEFSIKNREETFQRVIEEALEVFPLTELGYMNAVEYFNKSNMPTAKRIMESIKEARHRRDQCMECTEAPFYEVLWAEGMGHAWFCRKHFASWSAEHKGDIDYVKETRDCIAAKKFKENPNPNIKDKIGK